MLNYMQRLGGLDGRCGRRRVRHVNRMDTTKAEFDDSAFILSIVIHSIALMVALYIAHHLQAISIGDVMIGYH